jgi:hypothetical protein
MKEHKTVRVGVYRFTRPDALWYYTHPNRIDRFPLDAVGDTLLRALLRCRHQLARVREDWVPQYTKRRSK